MIFRKNNKNEKSWIFNIYKALQRFKKRLVKINNDKMDYMWVGSTLDIKRIKGFEER